MASSRDPLDSAWFVTSEPVDEAMRRQERSGSGFIDEAKPCYIDECEWSQLLQYGEARARAKGIGPEDVADLVEEYRGRRKE